MTSSFQSPVTPFGLRAATAMANLKHAAASEELPDQPVVKKPKTSAESALKMKEAASALTGLARSVSNDENSAPPPKFSIGLSAQKQYYKNAGVAAVKNDHQQRKNVYHPPSYSIYPAPLKPSTLQSQQPINPGTQAGAPPRRSNPLGWMWPSLPVRAPYNMFGYFPGMHPKQQQQPQHPSSTSSSEDAPRYQRRPVKPPTAASEWTEDDEQRLKDLEADYRREQAKIKRQAWIMATNFGGPPPEPPAAAKYTEIMQSVPGKSNSKKALPTAATATMDFDPTGPYIRENDFSITGRKKRMTWSDQEDDRLKSIVAALEGEDKSRKANWTDVARLMPGRDSKQCRDRWLNHLDVNLTKSINDPWTAEEDRKLVMFIKKYGTRWRLMQLTILPTRSELTIKNRWNSSMKRRYTRFLADKWGVPQDSIQLLNSQGLLHPGVSEEQMLAIAKCHMAHVNRSFGEPLSDREKIVKEDPSSGRAADCIADFNAAFANSTSPVTDPTPLFVRIFMTKMTDEEAAKDMGVIEIPREGSFAATRMLLLQLQQLRLTNNEWKFSLPEYGIITAKQEVDLGSVHDTFLRLGMGKGTKDDPAELAIVEQA
jgi:hypothetical protein